MNNIKTIICNVCRSRYAYDSKKQELKECPYCGISFNIKMTSIEENNHTLPKSMDRICKKHDKIISESIGMCSSCHRDYLMLARSEGIYSVIKKANEDFAQDILNRYFDENSETDVTSLHRELTDLIEGK